MDIAQGLNGYYSNALECRKDMLKSNYHTKILRYNTISFGLQRSTGDGLAATAVVESRQAIDS